jgi:hypothetical protein
MLLQHTCMNLHKAHRPSDTWARSKRTAAAGGEACDSRVRGIGWCVAHTRHAREGCLQRWACRQHQHLVRMEHAQLHKRGRVHYAHKPTPLCPPPTETPHFFRASAHAHCSALTRPNCRAHMRHARSQLLSTTSASRLEAAVWPGAVAAPVGRAVRPAAGAGHLVCLWRVGVWLVVEVCKGLCGAV